MRVPLPTVVGVLAVSLALWAIIVLAVYEIAKVA